MSLTTGTVALRLFHLPRAIPDVIAALLNAHRLPAFDSIKDAPVYGWLPGQDITPGREVTSDTIRHHGHTMATLVRAERKVPTNLLRAECRAQERIRLEAEGRQFLLFADLYASYCAQRSVASVSSVLQSSMKAWVADRQAIS